MEDTCKPPKDLGGTIQELKEKFGDFRFPLFTAWFQVLLMYKLAYEFVKKKGLMKEFQIWQETEGVELAKTFYKQALEATKEQEEERKSL